MLYSFVISVLSYFIYFSFIEKNTSLSHLCRLKIVRLICQRKDRYSELVSALHLPHIISQYLKFPELASHADSLGRLRGVDSDSDSEEEEESERDPLSPSDDDDDDNDDEQVMVI